MGLWSRLFPRRSRAATEDAPAERAPEASPTSDTSGKTVELPTEPFVFECQSCGKVFEARRKRPQCPECDSPEVSLMSE
jgi:rubrerythrin